jgi:tetratricopeptide (TPR) repeat protein
MKNQKKYLKPYQRMFWRIGRVLSIILLIFIMSYGESLATSLPEKSYEQTLSIEEGIRAESDGQWERALDIYKSMLEKEPERIDLWIRISDIEARLGNRNAAADALHEAAKLSKNNSSLYYRLSQAYSVANKPLAALEAIEKAVELEPSKIEYLEARGKLGIWNGKYDIAIDSYERLLKLSPDNDKALLNLARIKSWNGELNSSDKLYSDYLKKHPEDKDALLEQVKIKTWKGNSPEALSLLERYYKAFGETDNYLKEKARVLALANRPKKAFAIILPQLRKTPDDYELNYSNTISLFYAQRFSEAVESLNTLRKLRPDTKETMDITKFVMTPLRSYIKIGFNLYHDTDSLDIYHWHLNGTYSIKPETKLQALLDIHYLRADKGSGLENIDGSESTWHRSMRIGIMHRFSEKISTDGYFGWAYAKDHNNAIYGLGIDIRPADEFRFQLSRKYGYYLESARTTSLGIKRGMNRLEMQWEPDLRYTIIANAGYDTFSDDNERWEFIISLRRLILRCAKINLDAGINVWRFGFDKDPHNGYYAPTLYQRYTVASFLYWKINDNNGLSITGSVGVHKDETMNGFRMTYDASFEGTFGIYQYWMLKINGGITHNLRKESSAFRAYTLGVSLTKRF